MYYIDKKPERIKAIRESIVMMIKSGRVDDWTWTDALQMSMPVFARLGKLYNDSTSYQYMYSMYLHSKNVQGGG